MKQVGNFDHFDKRRFNHLESIVCGQTIDSIQISRVPFPRDLLRDRVAIVTGGSRGIGRATVQRLAEAGAHVVVNYVCQTREAEEAVNGARALGVQALAVQGDVSQTHEAAAVVDKALSYFGRLDLVVANAG